MFSSYRLGNIIEESVDIVLGLNRSETASTIDNCSTTHGL